MSAEPYGHLPDTHHGGLRVGAMFWLIEVTLVDRVVQAAQVAAVAVRSFSFTGPFLSSDRIILFGPP